jgi:hypothetical protein
MIYVGTEEIDCLDRTAEGVWHEGLDDSDINRHRFILFFERRLSHLYN